MLKKEVIYRHINNPSGRKVERYRSKLGLRILVKRNTSDLL